MSRVAAVWDWLRLARPPNVVLGMVGVFAGGLAAHGLDVFWIPLGLGVVSTMFGIAAANALNDAFDASVDAAAHPRRPVVMGRITPRQAAVGSAMWFFAALALAWSANLFTGVVATLLILLLLAYEAFLKRRGLLGNVAVSVAVGATFLMGALAGSAGPAVLDPTAARAAAAAVAWDVVGSLAVMAFLANVSRELYKDIQDLEADRGRHSLPMQLGVRAARWLAGVILVIASVFAIALFYVHPRFEDVYLMLVLPAVIAFVLSLAAAEAAVASRAVKMGMAFAMAAFLSVGLL